MVVPKMKEMPSNDPLFGEGRVRAGRPAHPQHVPVPGENAGRVESAVVLKGGSDDPGRRSVPADRPGQMPLGGEELILLVVRRIPPICITVPIRGATGTSGDAKLIPWNQGARCSPMIGVTPPSRRPHPCLRKFKLI